MKLALAVAIVACLGLASDAPRVAWLNPPHFVKEGNAIFNLRIRRDTKNRTLAIAAFDQADGERVMRSERPIDGDTLSILRLELWLPSGDLALLAVVLGESGELGRAQTDVHVQAPLGRD